MTDEWNYVPPKPKLETEHGSEIKVRFMETSQVTLYDSEGNVLNYLCDKCKKPAVMTIMGKTYSINLCNDCAYPKGFTPCEFVYREPK